MKNLNAETDSYEWYWGKNRTLDKYRYILDMVIDEIDATDYKVYITYLRDNSIKLCEQINNLSQVNKINFKSLEELESCYKKLTSEFEKLKENGM